jgi:hypothetical protein
MEILPATHLPWPKNLKDTTVAKTHSGNTFHLTPQFLLIFSAVSGR